MTKKSSWKIMSTSDVTMDRQHDIAQDKSDTIQPYTFSQKGHMRHDEQNDISPNRGRIRRLGATWSWCVVLSIVIGPLWFLDDSGADEGGISNETRSAPLSTSSGGDSCDSLPSLNGDQLSTEGSASNCQKQDGDLVAHEINGTRRHFYRIDAPFGKHPQDVDAAFVTDCKRDKASPGRCLDYADAYKNLRKLAFDKTAEQNKKDGKQLPQGMIEFDAIYNYAQTDGKEIKLTEDTKRKYLVRVPREKRQLKDQEENRLQVRTTLTLAGKNDHNNDEWRLVEVAPGPVAANQSEGPKSKWKNICGQTRQTRLAMVMFGRVETNYPDSGSQLRLDMVLKLKPDNKIDTQGLDMVIVCETAMTAKCAYEHGYRPWAALKDRHDRAVPPEDLAALLSTCALASTQCTKGGNHIVVIDDLGMNRPYPLDYANKYFGYEGTFRHGDGDGPHREHVCRLREGEISPQCAAHFNKLEAGECEFEDENKYKYKVRMLTYLEILLENPTTTKVDELLITEDGRWFAGRGPGLPLYNGGPPPFGISERRVMILSKPGDKYPEHPAGVLPKPVIRENLQGEIELAAGHIYTLHRNTTSKQAEDYLKNLQGNPFDVVECKTGGTNVACFMYKSKGGKVRFDNNSGAPTQLYRYHRPV